MKIILLCSLALLLSAGAGSCKKTAENQLPPATQTGANTFGCKINGVVYKCRGWWKPGSIFISEGVSAGYLDGKVGIVALTKNPDNKITLEFNCPFPSPGVYKEKILYQKFPPVEDYNSYIEITRFDNDVLSGIFQLKVKHLIDYYDDKGNHITGEGKTYTITEGRFDIQRNN